MDGINLCIQAWGLKVGACHSSVSSHRRATSLTEEQPPLVSLVSVRTLPSPCLCLRLFISGVQLNFKTSNFRDSHSADPPYFSRRGSCFAFPAGQLSRKVVAQLQGSSQFMGILSRKLAPRGAVLSQLLHSSAWEQHSL